MTTCPGCGKVVYFAERQTREGKDWHGKCLQVFLKEQGKGAKGASYATDLSSEIAMTARYPFHSYTDASREPAPNQTAGTVASAPAGTIGGAPKKFCATCGKQFALGDKFCASCGATA